MDKKTSSETIFAMHKCSLCDSLISHRANAYTTKILIPLRNGHFQTIALLDRPKYVTIYYK